MQRMPLLGVNIDHVATVRQARLGADPDPLAAARICERAGADSIVAHLREDRRHIHDKDILRLRKELSVRFNLEMSVNKGIVDIACRVRPEQVTLVPERRQELTTEGGLDVAGNARRLQDTCVRLAQAGIEVSLFIAPDRRQIDKTRDLGITTIELHTGRYAEAMTPARSGHELKKINDMTLYARQMGMTVNAGHGLNYHNTYPVARIRGMHELNIGHSIVAYAVFFGLEQAVRQMKKIINGKASAIGLPSESGVL
jgi:pyridoxine 5-phosphate synthase